MKTSDHLAHLSRSRDELKARFTSARRRASIAGGVAVVTAAVAGVYAVSQVLQHMGHRK